MVLGIVGFVIPCFWFFEIPGVLAIIFGAISLSQHERDQPAKYRGRGMAIAGLVLGLGVGS